MVGQMSPAVHRSFAGIRGRVKERVRPITVLIAAMGGEGGGVGEQAFGPQSGAAGEIQDCPKTIARDFSHESRPHSRRNIGQTEHLIVKSRSPFVI